MKLDCTNCSRATEGVVVCMPSPQENMYRGHETQKDIFIGALKFNNLAMYQLLCMKAKLGVPKKVTGSKFMNKRDAILKIKSQIEHLTNCYKRPSYKDVQSSPYHIQELIKMGSMWKIEWMEGGNYDVEMSETYRMSICDKDFIMNSHTRERYATLPKLADTMWLENREDAYHTWVKSIEYPGHIAEMATGCLMGGGPDIKIVMVRMLTIVVSYEYLITGTVVSFD